MAKPTRETTKAEPALTPSRFTEAPARTVVRDMFRAAFAPTAVLVILIAVWEFSSKSGILNPFLAPAPSAIGSSFRHLIGESYFWSAARATLIETLAGFALGVISGFLAGTLTSLSPLFRRCWYPYVIAFQNMPRVALAPLFVTWFGFGLASKIVVAATIAFFPLVVNTVAGLRSVDRDAELMMRSVGASRWQMFRYLMLPSAAPHVLAAVKTALTLALIGAIVGEFVGASEGLGVLLKQFQFHLDTASVFVVIFFLAAMGLVLYGLIAWAESKIIYWRTDISGGDSRGR